MNNKAAKNIFLSGGLKAGKSTIINKVLAELKVKNIGGFRTLPIYENNIRTGFVLQSITGKSQLFAHTNLMTNSTFDNYHFDIAVFDTFGCQLLEQALNFSELILMDEIGVMEEKAIRFKKILLTCLDSSQPVLGAFQQRAKWFANILEKRRNTKIFLIDETNRDHIHEVIISNLKVID